MKLANMMVSLGTTALKVLGPIVAVAMIASLATKAFNLFWDETSPKSQKPAPRSNVNAKPTL